ncbi:MAG: hypothetical protein HQ567_17980 [Candidatus Nealsonbacteria bacterium]|nr:hypothetical protein [Candidatus Nealsonbacteria bacterium]
MTSLIGWAAIDQRGPSAVYFASDSRLSGAGSQWDCGRKLFACLNSPDIFAYCGAVLFPTQVLGQLTAAIDAGLLFSEDAQPEEKLAAVSTKIKNALRNFPESKYDFSIAYATRGGSGFDDATFVVATIAWHAYDGFTTERYSIPAHSDLLFAYGTGATAARESHLTWKVSDVGRTSRAVFSAFCDAIRSGQDQYTGGAPQLVGIYLRGPARVFGIFHDGSCYLHGMLADPQNSSTLECRNALFEPCNLDGQPNGKRHSRPRRRKL